MKEDIRLASWTIVSEWDCELEGPFQCPHCGGHLKFDATFLDQVDLRVRCPYCGERSEVKY